MNNGVAPSFVAWSLWAPTSTRWRTTSRWPSCAATNNGVSPLRSAWSLSAPASINNCRLSTCPLSAAQCNGVVPCSSLTFGFKGFFQQTLKFNQFIVGGCRDHALGLLSIRLEKLQDHKHKLHWRRSKNLIIRDLGTIFWKESLSENADINPWICYPGTSKNKKHKHIPFIDSLRFVDFPVGEWKIISKSRNLSGQDLLHSLCSFSFEFIRGKDCQLCTWSEEAHLHRADRSKPSSRLYGMWEQLPQHFTTRQERDMWFRCFASIMFDHWPTKAVPNWKMCVWISTRRWHLDWIHPAVDRYWSKTLPACWTRKKTGSVLLSVIPDQILVHIYNKKIYLQV